MRLKDFLICVAIFTVIYIIFFKIYDFITLKLLIRKKKKIAYKKIQNNSYHTFALFYGLNSNMDKDNIKRIYDMYKNESTLKISEVSKKLNVSNNELVIILLYLEYLGISPVRNIYLQGDCTTPLTSIDQTLVNKYTHYLENKNDFNTIKQSIGVSTSNDLYYIDSRFIFPGVRFINSIIYYVGDINEKK